VKASRWAWWVATGFGSGWIKPAPGTWGSLAALAVWLLLTALVPLRFSGRWWLEIVFLALPALMTWIGIKASDQVVRETGHKDPGYIVVDEWAGLWIALWPVRWLAVSNLPRLFTADGWRYLPIVLVPFLLFRLFDIWKPWPIRQIQVLPDGQGVVVDDVIAGLYALVVTQALMPVIQRVL